MHSKLPFDETSSTSTPDSAKHPLLSSSLEELGPSESSLSPPQSSDPTGYQNLTSGGLAILRHELLLLEKTVSAIYQLQQKYGVMRLSRLQYRLYRIRSWAMYRVAHGILWFLMKHIGSNLRPRNKASPLVSLLIRTLLRVLYYSRPR